MNQRNIVSSFDDYADANAAAGDLSEAGFGDVQVRVLPPRTTYGRYHEQQIVVSAIVDVKHANRAERIFTLNGGSIDLRQHANWGDGRGDRRRDSWSPMIGAAVALMAGFVLVRFIRSLDDDGRHEDLRGQFRRRPRSFRSVSASPTYPDGDYLRRPATSRTSATALRRADEGDLAWADDVAPLQERRRHAPRSVSQATESV